ncbi:hypothetical protein GCM10009628_06540 [Paeniglutamicibacter kerguelensis]
MLVQQRNVELALAGEVLVEHGFGDLGDLGDFIHRSTVEAMGDEYLVRGLQKLAAAGLARHPLRTNATAGGSSHIGPFEVQSAVGCGGLSCKSTLG